MKTTRQIAEEIVNKLEPKLLQRYNDAKVSSIVEIQHCASVYLERYDSMIATVDKVLQENIVK
jgi:proline dehydrogenase